MTLSVAELSLVVADLRERLLPAHLERVRSPAEQGLLFELRAGGRSHWLLASFEPTASRLHLTDRTAAGDRPAEGFARTVHAALAGRRLLDLEAVPNDRAVRLVFGDRQLVLELTGRHANAFLLDAGGTIGSSFRPSQSRKRRLLWGEPYQAPLPRSGEPWQRAQSRFPAGEAVHAAIAAHYAERAAEAVEMGRRRGALLRLRQEVRRLARLVPRLEGELDEARQAEAWRRRGELLKGAPADTPRGATSVRVPDWFDPATPEVEVPLDPALGLRENMARCFRRARKLGRRPEIVGPKLEAARRDLRRALDDLALLESAPWDDPAARAVRERWAPAPGSPAARPVGRRRGPPEHVPFRRFLSADGHEILVGKSARDNDRLAFQVARGFDAWLHVAGAPGSHVIVRVPKGRPATESALRDAALLALHYSRLAGSGEGEVYVARRADVRRVRGGSPGQVTVREQRRIWVRTDPDRLRALLDTAGDEVSPEGSGGPRAAGRRPVRAAASAVRGAPRTRLRPARFLPRPRFCCIPRS